VEANLQWQRHWLQELADEVIPGSEPAAGGPREVPVFDLTLHTLTGEALYRHTLAGDIHGTVGVSGSFQDNATSGEVPLIPPATSTSGAVFLLEQGRFGPLELLAGVRSDLSGVSADASPDLDLVATDRAFGVFSWSVGGVLHAGPAVQLSANVGRAWRAPTLAELFSDGPRLGELRYDEGDPNLDPEKGLSVDGGIEADAGLVRAELHGFWSTYSDYIFTERTEAMRQDLRVYRYRQADATVYGGEASLEVRPRDFLALRARTDLVRGTNDELDQPLPLMPPPRVQLEGEFRFDAHGWTRSSYARLEWELVSEQKHLAPSDVPVGDYDLVHLGGGFATRFAGMPLQVDLRVRNLLDTSYRDFLSRYKEFALNPGRSLVLRLSTGL
jgi:outer membrane receptor protein involved in Fe transport